MHCAKTERVGGVLVLAMAAGLWLSVADQADAQRGWGWPDSRYRVQIPERDIFPDNRFTFCRIRYTSIGYGAPWNTDYPESDQHFSWRLSELTT
ncbi:MAG: hypothetical protein QGD90_03065, partial [Candidatus Hydrogenedentes bacterium]|nr:hypothetical protein [Candidatus Hydrogenedentota bacterium]